MSDPAARRRLWMLGGGVVLLVLVMFTVPAMLPDANPGASAPAIVTPGATPGAPAPAEEDSGGGFSLGGGDVASLILRLGLVAAIVGAAVVGLRWWGKRTSNPRSITGFVRIVDTLAINNARSIHLVALGNRVVAVGATAQQMSLLLELDDEQAATVLSQAESRDGATPIADFAAELFQSFRRGARQESATYQPLDAEVIGR